MTRFCLQRNMVMKGVYRHLDNGEQTVIVDSCMGTLEFEFVFGTHELDEKNWVVDFGSLKELEGWLRLNFDHKTLVASDDPVYSFFEEMHENGIIDMVTVEGTGCEMFAKIAMEHAKQLIENITEGRCWVESVTVREHGANSATCMRITQ